MEINYSTLKEINVTMRRLNNIRRWTGYLTEGRYDEISKQSLNCVICFMLAVEAESKGKSIKWERFPKIALYRAFQKAYVNFDTPEHILKDICELGNIQYEKTFNSVTAEIITELTDGDFEKFLEEGCGTQEEQIYKAATKIATLLELKEIQRNVNGEYGSQYEQILKTMGKYDSIPGFKVLSNTDGGYFRVFKAISKLRNQNRWAAYSYNVDCSVLGHLFDTAVFAYWMALEKGETEETATRLFFMGIFHDVPEAFTRDIPSPIKDKIPGFRKLTEQYEMLMMEEKVYPYVSEEVKKELKKVLLEEEENSNFKPLMKAADYMSAITEIWRQFEDPQFYQTMKTECDKIASDDKAKFDATPMIKELSQTLKEEI